jgi:membrane protease YdiL (CAAX protease family)
MIQRKPLLGYLLISFGLGWLLFLLPLAFGAPETLGRQAATGIAWALSMWAPGIAAIIATKWIAHRSAGDLNLHHVGDLRMYLWAWLLPMGMVILTGLLTMVLGFGKLDLEFSQLQQTLEQVSGSTLIRPAVLIGIQVAVALTIAPLINMLFTVGEELGWRGFLLPELLPLGQWRAIILSGGIWGLWHAPAILQGHNYPGQPVLGVGMMIVFCVLYGAFLSWLYLRTRSPWAPALGHATLNAIAGIPILFLSGVDITYSGSLTSPVGWIALLLFVAWLAWSKRLPVRENTTVETKLKEGAVEAG